MSVLSPSGTPFPAYVGMNLVICAKIATVKLFPVYAGMNRRNAPAYGPEAHAGGRGPNAGAVAANGELDVGDRRIRRGPSGSFTFWVHPDSPQSRSSHRNTFGRVGLVRQCQGRFRVHTCGVLPVSIRWTRGPPFFSSLFPSLLNF